RQISNVRSNIHLQEGDTSSDQTNSKDPFPPLPESFCHTFFRILGLPVLHKNKVEFYNPGFYGTEDTKDEKTRRSKIDTAQDPNLIIFEKKREQVCNDNNLAFNSSDSKIKYRLEMMQSPLPINMLDPTAGFDPLLPDKKQIIDNYPNRVDFKKVAKILRPFK